MSWHTRTIRDILYESDRLIVELNMIETWRKSASILALVVGTALLGGCTSKQHTVYAPPAEAALQIRNVTNQPPGPYRLQVGDLLTIRFPRNPELEQDVVIRPDGMISLPYVDEVRASGLTPAELDAELTTRYTGQLATPNLTVIVVEYGAQKVYVGGEVREEGIVELTPGLTLFRAIYAAGGFEDTARPSRVVLVRRAEEGQLFSRYVDTRPIASGEDPGSDVLLRPYDMVFVPRSGVTNVNLWVKQYIRDNIPINFLPVLY